MSRSSAGTASRWSIAFRQWKLRMATLMRREPYRTLLLSALLMFVAAYSLPFDGLTVPNERSRLYLAIALVDHGTFSVDEVIHRYGPILDLAKHDGHFYSDKAPGSSLVGALVYAGLRVFSERDAWQTCELLAWIRLGGLLPLSIGAFAVLRSLLLSRGLGRGVCDLSSLAWFVASPALHYSVAFYGHQIVSSLAILALWCVDRARRNRGQASWAMGLIGGACVALMLMTEYQAVLIAIPLLGYTLWSKVLRRMRFIVPLIGASTAGVVLLFAYNSVCFGGVLELSYQHLANRQLSRVHGIGLGGVTVPSWGALVGVLLSFHRGLLTTAPWTLLALVGAVRLWRQGEKHELVLLGGVVLAYVLFVGSSNMWVAGWSYGPRLLVPVLGWVTILVALGIESIRGSAWISGATRGAILVSLASYQALRCTLSEPPPEAQNPLVDVVIPALSRGLHSPNLATKLGILEGWVSLVPLLGALFVLGAIVLRVRIRAHSQERKAQRFVHHLSTVGSAALLLVAVSFRGPGWMPIEGQRFVMFLERLVFLQDRGLACALHDSGSGEATRHP